MSPATAQTLSAMMVQVVEPGHRDRGPDPGVTVAGKTGTAETGRGEARTPGSSPSPRPKAPQYAVAVLVEHGGNDNGDEPPVAGRGPDRPRGAAEPPRHESMIGNP